MKTFGQLFGYIWFRLFWFLFCLIPARRAFAFGHGLGCFAYRYLLSWTRHANCALENLQRTGIATDKVSAQNMACDAFGNFLGHLVEAIRLNDGVNIKDWQSYVEIEASDATKALFYDTSKPVMFLTGHLGSWEVGASILAQLRPMIAVARALDNHYVANFLAKHQFRGNIRVIAKAGGFSPSVLREWAANKSALTIVMDHFSGKGMMVEYFGYGVRAYTSPARIHLQTGHPVLVGAFIRTGIFQYKIILSDPIVYPQTSDRTADIASCTALFMKRIESIVRRYPEQYLWVHRRWRRDWQFGEIDQLKMPTTPNGSVMTKEGDKVVILPVSLNDTL